MIHTTKSGLSKLQRSVTIADIKQVCSDSEGNPGRSWTFTIKTHSIKKPLVLQASSAETAATWVQLLSARLASHEERLQKHKICESGLGQAHAGGDQRFERDSAGKINEEAFDSISKVPVYHGRAPSGHAGLPAPLPPF